VLGVIVGEKTKVYPIASFPDANKVINETFNGLEIVVVGDKAKNFAVSFKRKLSDGTLLEFETVENELPVIMKDNEGSKWDIFGNAVSGPRVGDELEASNSFISYWFAWAAFYPNAEIYSGGATTGMMHILSVDFLKPLKTSSSGFRFHEIKKKELDRTQILKLSAHNWDEIMAYTEFVPHIGEDKIQGFEIWNSNPYSPLNGLGILNGDIITEVNGVKLNSTSSLYRTLETLKRGGKFLIELERNGRPIRYLYTYQ
jgi:hypothetical protein